MKQFKRDKIRMYAFLTVCLIVCILLFTVGVFAEENNSLVSEFDITEDDVLNCEDFSSSDDYNSSLSTVYINKGSVKYTNIVDYINNGLFSYPSSVNNTYADVYLTNHSGFTLCESGNTSSLVCFTPDDSFVSYESSVFVLYIPKSFIDDNNLHNNLGDEMYFSRFNFVAGEYRSFNNIQFNRGVVSVDGVDYLKYNLTYDNYLLVTSLPIYYNGGSPISTLEGIDNINYSGLDDTSSVSGESELNNLYFPTSDFKWRVESYGISYNWPSSDLSSREFAQQALSNADRNMLKKSNWGSGAVDFTAVPTDYQREHPEEFKIKFKFMCWMKYFTPTPLTAIEGSSWKGYYIFATNPYEVDVPLSTFINNGNIKTFNMSDIFSNLSITSTNTDFNTTIQGAYSQLREEEYLLWDNSTDLGWKLQASAQIYPTDSNLNENSGFNTETYNFITQISKQTEDSLSNNDYPYSPDDETNENTPDIGGDNSQSVTSGNGQITLTNNDNDVININDGNAETVEDIYNDLTVSDGEDSLSQRFKDLVNENAWITIMQETFSFIPSTIWVSLEIFVVTALGILAASFVLRIILDLL